MDKTTDQELPGPGPQLDPTLARALHDRALVRAVLEGIDAGRYRLRAAEIDAMRTSQERAGLDYIQRQIESLETQLEDAKRRRLTIYQAGNERAQATRTERATAFKDDALRAFGLYVHPRRDLIWDQAVIISADLNPRNGVVYYGVNDDQTLILAALARLAQLIHGL